MAMRRISLLVIFLLESVFLSSGQINTKLPAGFPDRSPNLDALPGFKTPPRGYGEVSFYWWVGDTLTKERITSQLEMLKNKGITGLQINYCHTDKGGATYGLTFPSQPALFSEKWWELFQWFLKEAKKRDMSVSLSDYTLGAAGQGWFVDEMLKKNPQLNGSKLEAKQLDVKENQLVNIVLPQNALTVKAFKSINNEITSEGSIELKPFIKNGELNWTAPTGSWKVFVVYPITVKTSFDPMNPLSGKKVVEKFYQRFEDHAPGEAGKGLNFFFSDELQFGIRGFLWNEAFASEFKKRKGYDVIPELPSLFADLGPRSYKIRLDYNDVIVSLSEDGFFKPVYEWHNSRGMLFGCDHGGRGKDVTEFGDYFRTQRWMSGPGCDQPGLGRDIVKDKVASSITHLYERQRTWLEGFYGSGWGTSSEEVADATFANFAMGQNLLSLHGLYYTTHGGWWEWAAPDNHWRQPYWANMGDFLKCTERLSYILSQGYHRCDIAMVYPVAPVEANLKGKVSTETAFTVAKELYPAGLDFDFIDFESLNRSKITNKEITVSGEKYKILVLPSLSAVRYSTIEKALEFYRAGGIVIAVGALPEASDRIGGADNQLQGMIREIFGTTCLDTYAADKSYSQTNKNGGTGIFIQNPLDVKKMISELIEPDFKVSANTTVPGLLHRKVGGRDLYFVYGIPKGTTTFFRSTGKVELWNPWNGTTQPIKVESVSSTGTTLRLPLEKSEPQLIVFSPGKAELESKSITINKSDSLKIDNKWEFEIKPTLDNQFGDYRLPAFNGKLGAECWKMKFAEEKGLSSNWKEPNFDDHSWQEVSVSYGPQFYMLGPVANTNAEVFEKQVSLLKQVDAGQKMEINGISYSWKPYEFSWRWGLKDDAGHQGYHGLKGKVNNELIELGKLDKSQAYKPTYPLSAEAGGSVYYLWSTVNTPGASEVVIQQSGLIPEKVIINNQLIDRNKSKVKLNSGNNFILLKYSQIGRGYFVLENPQNTNEWKQTIPLSTDWYLNPGVLPFNCLPQNQNVFGCYRLISPPGTKSFYINSKSKPEVWIEGKYYACGIGQPEVGRIADPNLTSWKVVLPEPMANSASIAIKLEQLPGIYGGAVIPEPIIFDCGIGEITLGDLGQNESLKSYSGGMLYRKTLKIKQEQVVSKNITIDLGMVVASAEVFINGKSLGSKVSSPWKFDLTGNLHAGENTIEVLVYNTLGNHYLTTPSMYTGRTSSGLIGPVTLIFTK